MREDEGPSFDSSSVAHIETPFSVVDCMHDCGTSTYLAEEGDQDFSHASLVSNASLLCVQTLEPANHLL